MVSRDLSDHPVEAHWGEVLSELEREERPDHRDVVLARRLGVAGVDDRGFCTWGIQTGPFTPCSADFVTTMFNLHTFHTGGSHFLLPHS